MSDPSTLAAWNECRAIARWLAAAVPLIVVVVVVGLLPVPDRFLATSIEVASGGLQALVAFRLARALGSPPAGLMALAACVPFLGILVVAYLSVRAARHLKASGIAISRMGGVPQAEFRPVPPAPASLSVTLLVVAVPLALIAVLVWMMLFPFH